MLGVEIAAATDEALANTELTNKLAKEAMNRGLIVRTSEYGRGNVIKFRPALIITKEEIDEACSIFEETIQAVLEQERDELTKVKKEVAYAK